MDEVTNTTFRRAEPRSIETIEYLVLRREVELAPPRRGHLACAALFYAIALAYGSWLPFEFSEHTMPEATAHFRAVLERPIAWSTNADFTINALLTVPLAFAAMAAFCADRSRLWDPLALPIVVAACAAVSLTIEFGQTWLPMRMESQNDVAAQVVGIFVGCGLWITLGRTILRTCRAIPSIEPGSPRLRPLLQLYVITYALYEIMPLDLVSGLPELRARIASGEINMVPLAGYGLDLKSLFLVLKKGAYYVPIGVYLALPKSMSTEAPLNYLKMLLQGLLLIIGIESGQAIVRTRAADISDVFLGSFGLALGIVVGRCAPWKRLFAFFGHERPTLLRIAAVSAATAYYCVLVGLFWFPFKVIRDPTVLSERRQRFFSIPFVQLWSGTEFNSLAQIVLKISTFSILGALAALAFSPISEDYRWLVWRRWLTAALIGISTGIIEAGQIYFADRYPDSFDIVLGFLGGMLGIRLVEFLATPPVDHGAGIQNMSYFTPHPTRELDY